MLRGLTRADALAGVGPLLDEAAASRPADIWLLTEIQSQLERAAGEAPLVVIVDDVDRADDLSLHAVRLLSDALETSAIAWFLTARAEPPPRLSRLRGSIARSGGLIVTLRSLGDADAIRLVEDILGSQPQASLVDLALAAGGNALLLTELAHGYLMEGRVAVGAGAEGGLTLPMRVREAIRSRVTAMPPDAIRVLEVAAVLGRSFRVADLAAVIQANPAEVMSALRPLLSEGMITERAVSCCSGTNWCGRLFWPTFRSKPCGWCITTWRQSSWRGVSHPSTSRITCWPGRGQAMGASPWRS